MFGRVRVRRDRRARVSGALLAVGATVASLAPIAAVTPTAGAAPEIVSFETRAKDGTALRGHVFLPAGGVPAGTVLQLSPYWNTVKGPAELQGDSEAVRPFLDAGFAVALVNLRGTGESDGCFQWGSPLDWSDAATVVTALAAEPWSNGNVGMYGTSYEAWSQFMAMADPPPALKAAVPISGVIDLWSLLTRRGAPISVGPAAALVFGTGTSFAGLETAVAGHAGCGDFATHLRQGAELVTTGDRTRYYAQRDLRPFLEDSRVPVL
ncbi:MAG: CocE/NonD family hydrolase, partial [Candidatus Methylomirabilales bacterium]